MCYLDERWHVNIFFFIWILFKSCLYLAWSHPYKRIIWHSLLSANNSLHLLHMWELWVLPFDIKKKKKALRDKNRKLFSFLPFVGFLLGKVQRLTPLGPGVHPPERTPTRQDPKCPSPMGTSLGPETCWGPRLVFVLLNCSDNLDFLQHFSASLIAL